MGNNNKNKNNNKMNLQNDANDYVVFQLKKEIEKATWTNDIEQLKSAKNSELMMFNGILVEVQCNFNNIQFQSINLSENEKGCIHQFGEEQFVEKAFLKEIITKTISHIPKVYSKYIRYFKNITGKMKGNE